MQNNKLSGEDLEILVKKCPNLYKLKLNDNGINNINNLKILSKLSNLKKIYVENNPFTKSNKEYAQELFKILGSIQCIDGVDKEGKEIESSIYNDEEEEEDDEEFNEEEDLNEDDESKENEDYNDKDEEDEENNDGDDEEDGEKPNKKKKK